MGSLVCDFRYGLRTLRQSPGFTIAAVATLALGIGATTAIFSMFDAFLLRLLPVKDPATLAIIGRIDPSGKTESDFPLRTFEEFRDRNRSLSGIFAYDATRVSVTVHGEPEFVNADFVSGNYFDVLGVQASLGRTLTAGDDNIGREPAAVVSHRFWKQRLNADPSILGSTISIGGAGFRIVGIMPAGFFGRRAAGKTADLILPMVMQPQLGLKDHTTFQIMARLRPGVTLQQARADLDLIYRHVLDSGLSGPATAATKLVQHVTLASGMRGDARTYDGLTQELRYLLAIIAIGLLIASINVANLLLARGTARRPEIGIRLAVGATRSRIVRQLLVESILLGLAGGLCGLFLAHWLTAALVFVLSLGREPVVFELNPDLRILAFTAATSILTGIFFGLAPALAASKQDLNSVLKQADRTLSRSTGRRTSTLVVPQVALSVVLLASAGLLLNGLRNLYRFDPGFERSQVIMAWIFPVLNGYDRPREMELYRNLLDRMDHLPGVQAATLERLRLVYGTTYRDVTLPGLRAAGEVRRVYCNQVGPRFFETMRIPLLLGREFSRADTEAAPRVAVISERLAQRLFPNTNPVGRQIDLSGAGPAGAAAVIGVVRDIRHHPDEREPHEAIYVPYTQAWPDELGQMNIVVRTANAGAVIPEIRQEVKMLDRNLPLPDIETQEEEIDEYLAGQRSLATLSTLFAAFALLLTSIGLYGAVSYAVGTRGREFGIRTALGASARDLVAMVLAQAFRQVLLGVAMGLPMAWVAAKVARSALFGAGDFDPMVLLAAVATLSAAAFVAAWLPARRAGRVDPLIAIR